MDILQIIEKKKKHITLSKEEIEYCVSEYTCENIPDYQMAALLMAISINSCTKEETYYLTKAMSNNGKKIFEPSITPFIDKHSTGGIGDKLTLVCVPIVAALGIPVVKMSGRGLGYTGGTIDKLESIPGFNVELTPNEIRSIFNRNGVCLCSNVNLKSDERIYQLRDVTSTVESIPLIASSIMSKKIVTGCRSVVIDIKVGKGALLKNRYEAYKLSEYMRYIAERENIKLRVNISIMKEPLGYGVGNAIEVIEAIDVLQNNIVNDVTVNSIKLSAHMCEVYGYGNFEYCYSMCKKILESGKAYFMFKRIIEAQGGDLTNLINRHVLDCQTKITINSIKKGVVKTINSEIIGKSSLYLGAGRFKKNEEIDYNAGIILRKKVGDVVDEKEPLADVYFSGDKDIVNIVQCILNSYTIV